ncbi:MAG: rhodanese-like domain-containing protein [Ignavibacteria bacterium]|nr:rhodanese-like domain-containing protein [Ignavibacteria bacterium]
MKWGMCSWDSTFAVGRWLSNMKNDRWAQFTQTATPKNSAGSLPKISTGKTNGKEILEARVEALLKEGYTPASISNATLYTSLSSYYIINYWPASEYNAGHVQGAVQYTPRSDLKSSTFLKTLPTDKPVVIYCYTGQTSSYLSAILRAMGYDAKSLLYGANAMMYDNMPANKFSTSEIKKYPWVK